MTRIRCSRSRWKLQNRWLKQDALEVHYVFPLEDGAAVYKFEAQFGSTLVRGEVKEKEVARKEYREAIKQNKQARIALCGSALSLRDSHRPR